MTGLLRGEKVKRKCATRDPERLQKSPQMLGSVALYLIGRRWGPDSHKAVWSFSADSPPHTVSAPATLLSKGSLRMFPDQILSGFWTRGLAGHLGERTLGFDIWSRGGESRV